jgi:hypothetical protein
MQWFAASPARQQPAEMNGLKCGGAEDILPPFRTSQQRRPVGARATLPGGPLKCFRATHLGGFRLCWTADISAGVQPAERCREWTLLLSY